MLGLAGSGHPGGSLSSVEILVALYFHHLRHDPKNPGWADRDRVIFSKGHGAPALYSALARAGYFDPQMLLTLRKLGSPLQGHPARPARSDRGFRSASAARWPRGSTKKIS